MYNITLLCTAHGEKGNCNIQELYNIINKIDPEVIFEEIPPSEFDSFYRERTRNNLESDTIIKYLENHKCEHIPVDLDYTPPKSFFDTYGNMHRRIEERSYNYKKIIDTHSFYREIYGFKYLNSIECMTLDIELNKEMETVLRIINDEKLYEIHKSWNEIMDKRENEMLKNIYLYSKNNEFNKGLFFIGSGHRDTIINKIQNYSKVEEFVINWNYSNYENIL
jgi:hypothetical protein